MPKKVPKKALEVVGNLPQLLWTISRSQTMSMQYQGRLNSETLLISIRLPDMGCRQLGTISRCQTLPEIPHLLPTSLPTVIVIINTSILQEV